MLPGRDHDRHWLHLWKANIQKLYYIKMAFTLIDAKTGKAVRVSLKPEFFEKALNSPFVQERKKGVPPQDIPAAITDPLVDRILGLSEDRLPEYQRRVP